MVTPAESIYRALIQGGLLPPMDRCPSEELAEGADLLPLILRAWGTAPQRGRARRLVQRLPAHRAAGARLTVGLPGGSGNTSARWLGLRLGWWPRGVPAGRRVGLVSSRLGRAPDRRRAWFTALRAACSKMDPKADLLVSAQGTTAARYVQRAAALFGLDLLQLSVPSSDQTALAPWWSRMVSREPCPAGPSQLHLSPPVIPPGHPADGALRGLPLQDRALAACSHCLMAFSVRPEGHVHRLLEARLRDPAWPVGTVYIAIGQDLVRTEMAAQLMDQGAVGWVVLETVGGGAGGLEKRRFRPPRGSTADRPEPIPAPVVPLPPAADWPFLTHATRRREGPWPDQTESDYLDSLILDRDDADHSALATLKRIVRRRRLVATSQTIRGGTPVVSFTAVPLAELDRLRVFRPHRGRWDFEPYGICIDRQWLRKLGARPVLYGNPDLWETLAPEDRPFFQLRRTRAPRGKPIDWAVEDEWRVVGDVDLAPLAAHAAMVFVPSQPEAEQVAAISPWPVTVVAAHRGQMP